MIFLTPSWVLHLVPAPAARFRQTWSMGSWRQFGENAFQALFSHLGNKPGVGGRGREWDTPQFREGPHRALWACKWLLHLLPLSVLPKKRDHSGTCRRGTQLSPRYHIPDIPDNSLDTGEPLASELAVQRCHQGATPVWFSHAYNKYFFSTYSKPLLRWSYISVSFI